MSVLSELKKSFDQMTPAEHIEFIRKLRGDRRIKKKIKAKDTMKGKKETKSAIKKKFEKMSEAEREALLKVLME